MENVLFAGVRRGRSQGGPPMIRALTPSEEGEML